MESFDDMIRRKLGEQPVPDFEEKYWLGAEKLLDEADRKRRRGLLFWLLPVGLGAGLLVAGLGFYAYFSAGDKQVLSENPVGKPIEKGAENIGKTADKTIDETIVKNDLTQSNIGPEKIHISDKPAIEKPIVFDKKTSVKPLKNRSEKTAILNKKGIVETGVFIEKTSPVSEAVATPTDFFKMTNGHNETGKIGDNQSIEKSTEIIDAQTVLTSKKENLTVEILPKKLFNLLLVLRSPKFPYFNPKTEPVFVKKLDKERVHFGLQMGGFSSQRDNQNKRIYGGQIGVFAQRKLRPRLVGQLFVDYKLMAGLNQSFSTDSNPSSVQQYRFGLTTVSGEPVPVYFHHVVPGINLRFQVIDNQWVEAGMSGRVWYGSHVKMANISTGPFGETATKTINGYSDKNYGWNKFVPEARLGWGADFGRNLQVSVGWNRQLKTVAKVADVVPGRYLSKNWFDVKLRYIIY